MKILTKKQQKRIFAIICATMYTTDRERTDNIVRESIENLYEIAGIVGGDDGKHLIREELFRRENEKAQSWTISEHI